MPLGHSRGVEAAPRALLTGGSRVASLRHDLEDPVKNEVPRSRFNNQEAVPGNLPELIEVDTLEAHVLRQRGSWWDLEGCTDDLHRCRSSRSNSGNGPEHGGVVQHLRGLTHPLRERDLVLGFVLAV
jgi:hypothetical protein